jgi:hypothetical protein
MTPYLHWFAIVLVITYGMTGSALFAPVRHFFGVRSNFLLGLLFCPLCFGFWVALAGAYFYPEASLWRFVHAPVLFTTVVLLGRLINPHWLTSDGFERELDAISEAGRQRDDAEDT